MVRAMCGLQLKDRKRSKDLMLMLSLNETIDQLGMANSIRWHGHVLRREDGHVERRAWDLRLKVNKRKGGKRRHGRGEKNERLARALCRSTCIVGVNQNSTRLRLLSYHRRQRMITEALEPHLERGWVSHS